MTTTSNPRNPILHWVALATALVACSSTKPAATSDAGSPDHASTSDDRAADLPPDTGKDVGS